MDLTFYGVLQFLTVFGYFVKGDEVVTSGDLSAFMGHRVQLPCKYMPSNGNSDWMFIRWKRTANGETINIASMQNNVFSADWASSVPEHFRDHVELQKRIGEKEYNLDLIIDGFICSDVGVYTCEVFTMSSATALSSSTKLDIEAHPGSPMINEDMIEVKENDTFRIECRADIGVPAHTITWAYLLKGAGRYLKVLEGVTQENTPGTECTFRGKSLLTVQMTPNLDGALFLCATVLTDESKPEIFDEVQIILFGKTTTTTSTTTATTLKIEYSVGDPNGGASQLSTSAMLTLCSLFTFVQYLFKQT